MTGVPLSPRLRAQPRRRHAFDDRVLEEAVEGLLRAGQPEAAAEAEALLAGMSLNRGHKDEALQRLERARELVEGRRPSPEKAFVLQELARVLMMSEDFERSIEVGSASLRMAEELGLVAVRSRNLNTLRRCEVVMRRLSGLDDLEEAIAIGAAANSHEEARRREPHLDDGQIGDSGAPVLSTSRLPRRPIASAWRRTSSGSGRSTCSSATGRADGTKRWPRPTAFIRDIEAGRGHYMETSCRQIRGEIELARGDTEAALADAWRATEAGARGQGPPDRSTRDGVRGPGAAAAGDEAGAAPLADELLEAWSESGVRPPHESVDGAWRFGDLGRSAEFVQALDRAQAQIPWHQAARHVAPARWSQALPTSTADRVGAGRGLREVAGGRELASQNRPTALRLRAARGSRLAGLHAAGCDRMGGTGRSRCVGASQPEPPQRRKAVTALPRACQSAMPPSSSGRA